MSLVPRSLSGRLIAAAVILIVLVITAAAAGAGFFLYHFVRGQLDQRLDAESAVIIAALTADPDGTVRLARPVEGGPPFDRPGWYWEVFAGSERIRSATLGGIDLTLPPHPPSWPLDILGPGVPGDGPGPHGEPLHFRIATDTVGGHPVTIVVTAPRDAVWRPLLDALTPVLVALAVAGLLLIAAMFFQVRLGLRPLAALRSAVADIRAGRRERVPGDQPAEIAPLADELNRLIADNDEGLARARRHVSNLAHGLKTPLATLSLALAGKNRDPGGELGALVEDMDRRIRHHLARARAAALHGPARARTEVAARLADIVAILPRIHPGRPLVVTTAVDPALSVACETQDFDEMVGNLLDNAGRFARSAIRVSAAPEGAMIVVQIEDDGPGLAGDRIPDVLRPGERLDESAPGYGFGLPITRELAELYGGALALGRSPLGGLEARLSLPAAR